MNSLTKFVCLLPIAVGCWSINSNLTRGAEQVLRWHHLILNTEPRTIVPFSININSDSIFDLSTQFLHKLFAFLDRDRDGMLNEQELQAAPSSDAIRQLLRGEFTNLNEQGLPLNMQSGVKVEAFTSEYQKQGCVGWLIEAREGAGERDNRLIDQLFDILAADDRRGLSQESFKHAAERLRRLDLNEDELWTVAELSSDLDRRPKNELPKLLVDTVYDTRLPDVVAESLMIGINTEIGSAMVINKRKDAPEILWRATGRAHVMLRGSTRLHVIVLGVANDFSTRREELRQHWETDDADQNQRLDLAEIDSSPQAVTWRQLARSADADRDQLLTADELAAYLDLLAKGAEKLVVVRVVDNGRMLFRLLDSDDDDRLTLRELSQAWELVAAWMDMNGDGYVSRDEIPRHFGALIGVGGVNTKSATSEAVEQPRAKGPEWFQKMDRNGDGDISPREYIGPSSEFQKLDRDQNRLLDAEEANAR